MYGWLPAIGEIPRLDSVVSLQGHHFFLQFFRWTGRLSSAITKLPHHLIQKFLTLFCRWHTFLAIYIKFIIHKSHHPFSLKVCAYRLSLFSYLISVSQLSVFFPYSSLSASKFPSKSQYCVTNLHTSSSVPAPRNVFVSMTRITLAESVPLGLAILLPSFRIYKKIALLFCLSAIILIFFFNCVTIKISIPPD